MFFSLDLYVPVTIGSEKRSVSAEYRSRDLRVKNPYFHVPRFTHLNLDLVAQADSAMRSSWVGIRTNIGAGAPKVSCTVRTFRIGQVVKVRGRYV